MTDRELLLRLRPLIHAAWAGEIRADSLRAEKAAEAVHTGFLAEDWVRLGGNGKDVHTSEVIATQWRTMQELIRRVESLEKRVTELEARR